MAEPSIETELIEQLYKLQPQDQKKVLDFAKTLSNKKHLGVSGKSLTGFVGLIPQEDLNEINQAILEGCETIDHSEW